jgi:hypothetical protein
VNNSANNKDFSDSVKAQSPVIMPQQLMRKLSSSQSQLSDQRSIRSNSNAPKVTFNYISPIPSNVATPHSTDRSANEK